MNLLELFRSDRAPSVSLSAKEIALLDAIHRSEPSGICAADVVSAIAKHIGKEPRLATVYGAISELERKGLVAETGFSSLEQGGRPRRLYRLTDTGRLARALGEAMVKSDRSLMPA